MKHLLTIHVDYDEDWNLFASVEEFEECKAQGATLGLLMSRLVESIELLNESLKAKKARDMVQIAESIKHLNESLKAKEEAWAMYAEKEPPYKYPTESELEELRKFEEKYKPLELKVSANGVDMLEEVLKAQIKDGWCDVFKL